MQQNALCKSMRNFANHFFTKICKSQKHEKMIFYLRLQILTIIMYEDLEFYKVQLKHRPNPRFPADYFTITIHVRIEPNAFMHDYYYHHMITQRNLSRDA
jgi:hypothetical protein